MASVDFPTERITDWASFHDECTSIFGFPDFYGRNMNAWIDCLSYLPEGDGMSRFKLVDDETLIIHIPEFKTFFKRVPEVCVALLESTAFVNQRYLSVGDRPRLALVLE